jgi:tubulin--tyrosine ligase
MADQGMGIRLFNSKESIQDIFEEFDNSNQNTSDDENFNDEQGDQTPAITFQLRHFVIQAS